MSFETVVNEHLIANNSKSSEILFLGTPSETKIEGDNIHVFDNIDYTKKKYEVIIVNCFLEKQSYENIDYALQVIFNNPGELYININCDYDFKNKTLLHPERWIEKLGYFGASKIEENKFGALIYFSKYKEFDLFKYDRYNTELGLC